MGEGEREGGRGEEREGRNKGKWEKEKMSE